MNINKLLYFILNIVIALIISILLEACSGCSQSGIREANRYSNNNSNINSEQRQSSRQSFQGKTIIKMQKVGGVFQIPVDVNGIRMSFIFDTGASIISISNTEAIFLAKQGLLSKEDIKGSESFSDAIGNISQGTIIVLRTVKIGDRVLHDIDASVVNNLSAPLLFGQTAMEKFGKISIDNSRGEVTFE
jgi:aspartyl protease family protein